MDELELGAGGQIVNAQNVEADRQQILPGCGQSSAIGQGHASQHALLVGIHGGFRGCEVVRGSGFDLEDDKGIAVPADKVEVATKASGVPPPGDNGVPKTAQVKKGQIFPALACAQMPGRGIATLGGDSPGHTVVSPFPQAKIEARAKPIPQIEEIWEKR